VCIDVLFHVFHFSLYGGINGGIDGIHIGIDLFQFLMGPGGLSGQGIEVIFKFLIAGFDHGEGKQQEWGWWVCIEKGLLVKGTTMIGAKRGIQWNRWERRVLERVGGCMRKKKLTSNRYYCDQGKERKPIG
jgi:hypothetical protein